MSKTTKSPVSQHQKPSKSSNKGWIVGGIITALLVLVVGVSTILYFAMGWHISDKTIIEKTAKSLSEISSYDVTHSSVFTGNQIQNSQTVAKSIDYDLDYTMQYADANNLYVKYKTSPVKSGGLGNGQSTIKDGNVYNKASSSTTWRSDGTLSNRGKATVARLNGSAMIAKILMQKYGDTAKVSREGDIYTLTFPSDDKELVRWLVIEVAKQQFPLHGYGELKTNDRDIAIDKADITITVHKETYQVKSSAIDIEFKGVGDDASNTTFRLKQETTFHSVNEPINIATPTNAKEA